MDEIINDLKNKLKEGEPLRLRIKVVAGAKKNSLEIFDEGIIKVRINKPAVEGKANKAIIDYLSDVLSVPKNNITIARGEKNSLKDLIINPKKPIM